MKRRSKGGKSGVSRLQNDVGVEGFLGGPHGHGALGEVELRGHEVYGQLLLHFAPNFLQILFAIFRKQNCKRRFFAEAKGVVFLQKRQKAVKMD